MDGHEIESPDEWVSQLNVADRETLAGLATLTSALVDRGVLSPRAAGAIFRDMARRTKIHEGFSRWSAGFARALVIGARPRKGRYRKRHA